MMGNAMVNALIAASIVFAIGYGWIAHLKNRARRFRATAGRSGGGDSSYSGASDGFSLGDWCPGGSSGSSTDRGSCWSGDSGSSSGGDCGGGGDGGGGGGGD
jgi:hypothetical protein